MRVGVLGELPRFIVNELGPEYVSVKVGKMVLRLEEATGSGEANLI
jgi:hypothetical protein